MKRLLVLVALLLPSGSAVAASEIVEPAEVAPGARGVCVTEMERGELLEIPLTVLGTLEGAAPEGEMVLVRLDDPRFLDTGIIAGMSGSPVYVDGKLLGALAFGWAFSRSPIGGVTPFSRMQNLGDQARPAATGAMTRPDLETIVEARRAGALGRLVCDWLTPEGNAGLRPLPLAMTLGGGTELRGWLAESWRRLGWVGAGAGTAASHSPGDVLVPGSMVAGILVDGDVSLAAAGTVTEVRGDQVWAFGHPFLGGGSLQMPLARAEVVAILPSLAESFKFFGVGEYMGTWLADRRHGIWGRLGEPPPMVPITVGTDGREYSFRCVRHPTLLPLLAAYLTNSVQGARGRTFGEQTVTMRVELDYGGSSRVGLEESFAGPDASPQAASLVAALIGFLESSRFQAPELEGVRIELEAAERLELLELVDAVPERSTVRPGETLGVRCRLRMHQGAMTTRRLSVTIPSWLPRGQIDLVVADGSAWTAYDIRMRPTHAASFADDLRLVQRLRPATTLVLALERRELGVALAGATLSVPPTVASTLRSALGPNLETVAYRVVELVEEVLPYPASAALRIPLRVRMDSEGEGDGETASSAGDLESSPDVAGPGS